MSALRDKATGKPPPWLKDIRQMAGWDTPERPYDDLPDLIRWATQMCDYFAQNKRRLERLRDQLARSEHLGDGEDDCAEPGP